MSALPKWLENLKKLGACDSALQKLKRYASAQEAWDKTRDSDLMMWAIHNSSQITTADKSFWYGYETGFDHANGDEPKGDVWKQWYMDKKRRLARLIRKRMKTVPTL